MSSSISTFPSDAELFTYLKNYLYLHEKDQFYETKKRVVQVVANTLGGMPAYQNYIETTVAASVTTEKFKTQMTDIALRLFESSLKDALHAWKPTPTSEK